MDYWTLIGRTSPNVTWRNSATVMRQRGYLNGISEALKAIDEALRLGRSSPAIEVVGAQILIQSSVGQHMIDGGEDRSGDGADGLLGAAPRPQAMELGLKVAALLARPSPGTLDKSSFEPGGALAHAIGSPLAGASSFLGPGRPRR